MTIIDTNIISEVVRPLPSDKVVAWMRAQTAGKLFATSITESEILLGLELMPAGRRRDALRVEVSGILYEDLAGRILPFDSDAAKHYARIVASRQRAGRPIEPPDAQIAAIALAHGYAIATRNLDDFRDRGVTLINPWDD